MKFSRPGNRLLQLMCALPLVCVIAACNSGSDGGGGTPPVASPSTGIFVDSPVQGLGYTCAPSGLSGITNANGQYNFFPGDMVTFTLYGRAIGTAVSAGPVVTALSVFDATSLTDSQVVNLSQLLLTLAGGPPAPGSPIVLPAAAPAGFPATIDFSAVGFDTSFPGLILVSETTATTHLSASFKTMDVTMVNGGVVTSTPAGITCAAGTCSAVFQTGTVVTLAATGTGFTGWSNGTGSANCSGTGTCVVTLNADSTVTATFPIAPPPATVTILPNSGTGTGTVTCSANGGAFGPCAASYPNPTPLVIQAAANTGSTFTGWTDGTGNATSCNNTAIDCSINLTANSVIRATFTLPVLNAVTAATTTANGGGGTVSCTANGGAAAPCGSYPVGAAIVMTATPNSASNFTGWSGGTGSATACNGTTTTCAFMLTGTTTTTANFNRPTVSVTIAGTGSVSSNPAGISNCTTNCITPFDRGTSVTLTQSGGNFTGWSGGCSGGGSCVVTVNANTSVTATFGAIASATHYEFVWAQGGALMAINPAAPTAPITVMASGVQGTRPVIEATYNNGSQTFTNIHRPIQTFAQGGRLWRVNTATSAGVPGSAANPAVQVTNETGATSLCYYEIVQTGSSTSRIIYESGGADADCSTRADNVSKLAPILADASTPPLTLPAGTHTTGGESVVFNFTTGQPTATLFVTDHLNADTLKRLDLATNVITTIQANVGTVHLVAQDTSDRVFLRNNNQIFLYTLSTNTLTSLLTTATLLHGLEDAPSDGTNLFVWEESGMVYRVPMTASEPADVVTLISTPMAGLYKLAMTNTRLILARTISSTSGVQQHELVSILKTGGSSVTLVPLRDGFIHLRWATGNFVYCNLFSSTTAGDTTAAVIPDDGTSVTTFALSAWSGEVRGDSYSPRIGNSPLSHIIRSVFGPSLANPHNGSTVTVHNAITPLAAQVVLGTQTTSSPNSTFTEFRGSGSSTALIGISHSVFAGEGTVVLFADRTQAGSLVLVPLPTDLWGQALN